MLMVFFRCVCAFCALSCTSTAAAIQQERSLDDAMVDMVGYDYGESESALRLVRNAVWEAADDPVRSRQIESRLLWSLRRPEITDAARGFICRQLAIIGSDTSVPVLLELLDRENTREHARAALEGIGTPLARDVLAVNQVAPERRTPPSPDISEWARLAKRVEDNPAAAIGDVVERLMSADAKTRALGGRLIVRSGGGATISNAYAALISTLEGDALDVLLRALVERGDGSVADVIASSMDNIRGESRDRAIRAIGELGGADHVRTLVDLAAAGSDAGRDALAMLHGVGVDQTLAQIVDESRSALAPTQGVEAVRALGTRRATSAADRLAVIASDDTAPTDLRVASGLALVKMTPADDVEQKETLLRDAIYACRDWAQLAEVFRAMRETPTPRLLQLVTPYIASSQAGEEAARTALSIAREVGDEHRAPAMRAVVTVRGTHAENAELIKIANDVVRHLDRRIGFVRTWEITGPYTDESVTADSLLDVAFAPENPENTTVEWSSIEDSVIDDPGIVNIQRALGGSDRVAYLRTVAVTGAETPATFEIGSDDGVKVWLNGDLVHENNVMRGLTPGQDSVDVRLQSGANVILMKISQGGGDWKGALRVLTREGQPLGDLEFRTAPLEAEMPADDPAPPIDTVAPGSDAATSGGFQSLFDGESLDGWHQKGGGATYAVEDGAIVGRVGPGRNSFLCTDREFADFTLELQFRFDTPMNSGIQFRSHVRDDGVVFGYQCEIDPSERAWTGGVYDESRRGWLYPLDGDEHAAARRAIRLDDWNDVVIKVAGAHIRTWINGVACSDFEDDADASGLIALQVHSGSRGQIRWRNIRIREEK